MPTSLSTEVLKIGGLLGLNLPKKHSRLWIGRSYTVNKQQRAVQEISSVGLHVAAPYMLQYIMVLDHP